MVISHKNKYLFVEVPRTGSTAIKNELIEHYNGETVLHKHATLSEFLKKASKSEKDYFIISGKRNPLDRTISEFIKYKHNHNDVFNRFSSRMKQASWFSLKYHRANYFFKRVSFAQRDTTTFEDYYYRFFDKPYCDFGFLDHPRSNYVVEFENITNDFTKMINTLGLDVVRELPHRNKTENKKKVFWEYYEKKELRSRVIKNTSIYYLISGYKFPVDWEASDPSIIDWLRFYFSNFPKILYWKYFSNR